VACGTADRWCTIGVEVAIGLVIDGGGAMGVEIKTCRGQVGGSDPWADGAAAGQPPVGKAEEAAG
jgi:hypothetical protein